MTSTWPPGLVNGGLVTTAPTSRDSGRSSSWPGVPRVISVRSLGGRDDREVGGNQGVASLGQAQRDAWHAAREWRPPGASVIDGWLNVAVTPAGRPETLKS